MEVIINQTVETVLDASLWDAHGPVTDATPANATAELLPPIFQALDKAISIAIIVVLFTTMVSLGCTMEVSKIKAHLFKPKGVAIAILSQYGIMPLTAFSLAKAFHLGPMEAVSVLICGCCPGGNVSNILALLVKGDMNLSIVMTTCSTALALGMMPLLLYLYCQGFPGLENAIPYGGITLSLLLTLVSCGIGIFINHRKPQYSKMITTIGMSILLISFVIVAILGGVTIGGAMFKLMSPRLIAIAALMPLTGYMLGYILSTIFRLNGSCRRTIAMETGCQNIQLCTTILRMAFSAEVIGPLYLFPFIYIAFQITEALIYTVLFRCHQRFRKPKKEEQVYETVDRPMAEEKAPTDNKA